MYRHDIGPAVVGAKYELSPWFHPGVPTYTLAEFREAHPSGVIRCGSCGEPQSTRLGFKHMDRKHGPDTLITVILTHNHYRHETGPEDVSPAPSPPPTVHVIQYEEGACERYVDAGGNREERLFGLVYRDVSAPERPYREVWYPTGEFRAALESRHGEA